MKTYQYQHTDGTITDKQFTSDQTALKFLEAIGTNWQLVTPIDDPSPLTYLKSDTAPDADGLVLSVAIGGETVGTLHCIRPDRRKPHQLAWYGYNAARTASGDAHPTREQAAADVLAWKEGRSPEYVQHAVVPWPVCAGDCNKCEKADQLNG